MTIQEILNEQLLNKKLICYIVFIKGKEITINNSDIGLELEDLSSHSSKSFVKKQIEAEIIDVAYTSTSTFFEEEAKIYIELKVKYKDIIYEFHIDTETKLNIK